MPVWKLLQKSSSPPTNRHRPGFGVPNPVREGRLRLTNLPWTLDSRELQTGLDIPYVFLINDLEANGYGIAELKADQIYTLSEGDPSQTGNRALIAAGTGLGEGLLTWNGRQHTPYPSEGGHADFAPRNEDEIDLLRFPQAEVLPGIASAGNALSAAWA